MKWLSEWIPIRRGEGLITSLMFLYIFGALTSYYILKPLRSGLFLTNLPSSNLVYAYWLSALFAGTLATPLFKLGRKVSAITLITGTNVLMIATLLYFGWAMGRNIAGLPYVYYVYVQVAPVLLVAQFWLLAGYIYDNRQAKRIYGLLGAGATAGALAGSFLVRLLRVPLGTGRLLLICVVICIGLIVLSFVAWGYRRKDPSIVSEQRRFGTEKEKPLELVHMVFGSRHLLLMVIFILLIMITSQLADWQINDAVQKAFSGVPKAEKQASIDEFFATFNLYTNVIGITAADPRNGPCGASFRDLGRHPVPPLGSPRLVCRRPDRPDPRHDGAGGGERFGVPLLPQPGGARTSVHAAVAGGPQEDQALHRRIHRSCGPCLRRRDHLRDNDQTPAAGATRIVRRDHRTLGEFDLHLCRIAQVLCGRVPAAADPERTGSERGEPLRDGPGLGEDAPSELSREARNARSFTR